MNVVFWHVTPCGSYNNRHFGRTCRLYHQVDKYMRIKNSVSSNWLLKYATLMMEAIRSSETSVLTGATLRNISEDGNS
jgi:hypothetical protein